MELAGDAFRAGAGNPNPEIRSPKHVGECPVLGVDLLCRAKGKNILVGLDLQPLSRDEAYLERYADDSIAYADRRVMQAMVACVDEGTGNLTAALDARGMWENTLLVWSADNGGPQYWNANNYPYRGGKGTDFEGGERALYKPLRTNFERIGGKEV